MFTSFYLSGAVFGLVFLPLVTLTTGDSLKRIRRSQWLVTAGFRLTLDFLRWFRIFSFNSRDVDPKLPAHPVIVIANHPTTIDVVAVLSVYRNASVVVKQKIWDDPLLRHVFRWCGHIAGGDGGMESNIRLLEEVKQRLAQGFPVVIFPEGTRSPPNGLGVMFKGAFAVASTTKTDILPVVITANPPALHKAAPWHALPDQPVDYRVRALEVVPVNRASARSLQRKVTELYCTTLGVAQSTAEP